MQYTTSFLKRKITLASILLACIFTFLTFSNPTYAGTPSDREDLGLGRFQEKISYVINEGKPSQYKISLLHIRTLRPSSHPSTSNKIFFIPGLGHTNEFWKPLMLEVMLSNKSPVSDMYAIDLPGHGLSEFPTNIKYGEIGLEEYVNAVRQTLSKMASEGRTVNTLVGHSMGGLIAQLLQESSLNNGSSISTDFGIKRVYLMASSFPKEVPWTACDIPLGFGGARDLVYGFMVKDPMKGWYNSIPDNVFLGLFYSPPMGLPVSGAPTPGSAALTALKDNEPFAAASELVGLNPDGTDSTRRLSVRANAFKDMDPSKDIELIVLSFSKDGFFFPGEQEALATHLKSGIGVIKIDTPDAVHCLPYTNPKLLSYLFKE